MSVTAEVAAAYRAGAASWDATDGHLAVNPWNGNGDQARDRVLAAAWRRGRLSRVTTAVRAAVAQQ